MKYLPLFKMPKPVKITGRSSSITNSFINSIIPVVTPTEKQVKKALSILGMLDNYECAYCGSIATEWDHLRPLVLNKKPTGHISEIDNLVPACGKCNQSKGNKKWHQWMLSDAPLSPKTKGIPDIDERIKRLKKYKKKGTPTKMNFESIVGKKLWDEHLGNCEQLQEMMRIAQVTAEEIKIKIKAEHDKKR